MAKATRADLRTSLRYKTDGGLTVAADQDYYLDAGEMELLPLWYEFDPDLFAKVKQTASTDVNGILLLPTDWLDLMRLEDANQYKYENIELDQESYATGYRAAGYDVTTGKRKLQIVKAGSPLASTALSFYTRERVLMGAQTTDTPIYPLEFRDLIAYRAAQLYFEDQGPSFYDAAEKRRLMFERRVLDAKRLYERPNLTPQFAQTVNFEAQGGGTRLLGSLSYYQ
jgi:hypothetical protein